MPVSRGELIRYRRLLELARSQRDAVAEGHLSDLPRILAERHALLAGADRLTNRTGPGDGRGPATHAGGLPHAAEGPGSPGSPVREDDQLSPAAGRVQSLGEDCEEADAEDGELAAEARELLKSILEVDRECQHLVSERLRAIEGDLAVTRTALEGSRAYRLSLEAGRAARVLDELK